LPFSIDAYGRSDVGQVRTRNEDTLVVESAQGFMVVADGMGGAPAGDVASALAVQEVAKGLHAGAGMEESVQAANRRILETAESQPAMSGMGTTLTALRVFPESRRYVVGHVGDSRAYLLSAGDFSQVSRDHTMVRDMVEAGRIPASAEREHPLGHILTRVLGTQAHVAVDVVEGELRDGDCFLLCSDGLIRVMDGTEVENWIRKVGTLPLEGLVDSMLGEANRRGAPDNVTVALLAVGSQALS
jgi:serine/threonine protein phosphatase PrpC